MASAAPAFTAPIPLPQGAVLLNQLGLNCQTWLGMNIPTKQTAILGRFLGVAPGLSVGPKTWARAQVFMNQIDAYCLSSGGSLLSYLGMSCTDWFAIDTTERTRRLVLAFWPPTNGKFSNWSKSDQAKMQRIINAIESYCSTSVPSAASVPVWSSTNPSGQAAIPGDPALSSIATQAWSAIYRSLGVGCVVWLNASEAQRQKWIASVWKLLTLHRVASFKGVTTVSAQNFSLAQLSSAISNICRSQIGSRPAGQAMVSGTFFGPGLVSYPFQPYPSTYTYWFNRTGLGCSAWMALDFNTKMSRISSLLAYAGQAVNQNAVAAIIRDIDSYCAGARITAPFLSPYAYPYSVYGYGYSIPTAFPFIARFSRFRIPGGRFGAPMGGQGGGSGGQEGPSGKGK